MSTRPQSRSEREARVWAAARELFAAEREGSRALGAPALPAAALAVHGGESSAPCGGGPYDPAAWHAVVARLRAFADAPGRSLYDELDQAFGGRMEMASEQPALMLDHVVNVLQVSVDPAERRQADLAVTQAIGSRLLHWRPDLGDRDVARLAFAMHALYITSMLGLAAGTLQLGEAQRYVAATVRLLTTVSP